MSTVPVGTVMMYAGDTDGAALVNLLQAGWLLCDGSKYPRTSATYSPLFTVIGEAFGGIGGSFAVPTFKGLFLRGVSGGSGNDPDAEKRTPPRPDLPSAGQGGNAAGSLQRDEIRKHTHTYFSFVDFRDADDVRPHQTLKKGSTTRRLTPEGGAETRPLNLYVNYIIKYRPADAQIPVGALVPYAGALPDDGTLARNGWLACDGAGLDQDQFEDLYTALESSHGANGSTFFLPDYRGRFLRGVQGTTLPSVPAYDPGAETRAAPTRHPVPGNSGNHVGSQQVPEYREHDHGYEFNDSYQHTAATLIGFHGAARDEGTEARTSGSAGGSETRPANISVNYLIKARTVS
jgi:microcystin-dependent protein